MAFVFDGANGLGSRAAFEQRKSYKENITDPDIDFLDTWYENPKYGLINLSFEPVVFLPGSTEENLAYFGDYAPVDAKAAPFVVKAFNDFREVYTELAEQGALPYPKFLQGLIPVKGYVDFDEEYIKHGLRFGTRFSEFLNEYQYSIRSFAEFVELFELYISENRKTARITKTGFLLSDQCPINVSGLCVELAKLPYSQDFNKGQMIQSQEFRCYSDAAKEVGFYIDKNAPWRLIANLESPQMRAYIKKYKQDTTVENILSRIFRVKTQYDDLDAILSFCVNSYKSFVREHPFYKYREYSPSRSREITKKGIRNPTVPQMPIQFWLQLLLKIRMLESGVSMDNFETLREEVLDIHDAYSIQYSQRPLKPALGKIGSYTAGLLRAKTGNRKIDSSIRTSLKDFF